MKAAVFALLIFIGCTQYPYAGSPPEPPKWDCDCKTTYTMKFDGNFENKNKYMQNPSVNCSDSVARLTVTSVTINDTIRMKFDDFNSSAFEIPLMDYHFKAGDPVHIVVEHYGCGKPKMLNPEVY